MKILIIGASGYLGRNIIKKLYKDGHKIYALVRESTKTDDIELYVTKIITIFDYKEIDNEIKDVKPDCFINVAGKYYGTHNYKTIKEMVDSNILFPTVVLDAVVNSGCENVIHTSSVQQCYNNEKFNPVNIYASLKQSFEDVIKYYVESKKIKVIVLQLFETYGADDDRNKIFNRIRRLKDNESMDLTSGKQKVYFCYIDDIAQAYSVAVKKLSMIDTGFCKKYAVRGEKSIELKEFIEKYVVSRGREYKLNWGKREYMDREILDASEYGEVLTDWNAMIEYDMGIKMCVEYDKSL